MKQSFEKQLVEVGKNKAGFPVYERQKSAPEDEDGRVFEHTEKEPTMGRRRFLELFSGALTSAAVAGIPAFSAIKKSNSAAIDNESHAYASDAVTQLSSEIETEASYEMVTDSAHFNEVVEQYASMYEKEVPAVLNYASKITRNDPQGRNRIEYLATELVADGVPEVAMEQLREQFPGLGFTESRFDASRVSHQGAKGILQVIPSTWKDLSDEGANVFSLVDQTRIAGDLLSQTYRHLNQTVGKELSLIEAEFFQHDTDSFEKYFLAPVLINSYNAGMGTMGQLIQWFVRTYGSKEKTIGMLGQEEILSGYDVFYAMAQLAKKEQPVSMYKEEASAYTAKVYGASLSLSHRRQMGTTA